MFVISTMRGEIYKVPMKPMLMPASAINYVELLIMIAGSLWESLIISSRSFIDSDQLSFLIDLLQ